eukprot:COSAG06_NODE_9177_length_1966_cov_15.384039_3_plen_85_part_00
MLQLWFPAGNQLWEVPIKNHDAVANPRRAGSEMARRYGKVFRSKGGDLVRYLYEDGKDTVLTLYRVHRWQQNTIDFIRAMEETV